MISYDLAKRLKEAGFPQEGGGTTEGGPHAIRGTIYPPPLEEVYFPTLEELIEECGERFYMLIKIKEIDWQKGEWEALSTGDTGSVGPTPEDAVAMLYLALNEKKDD